MNHLAICCRSWTQNIREIGKLLAKRYFPVSIYKKELREKLIDHWHVKLKVGEILIVFKSDIGEDIDAISSKTFRKKKEEERPNLKPAHDIYKSPGSTLTCKGNFTVNIIQR